MLREPTSCCFYLRKQRCRLRKKSLKMLSSVMLQSDFGSLPMSYAFMGMRFSLSRQLVLCALGSMESWVWHFLHSHVMLHVTTRWWNHQPWKPLGQVSTSKGRVAILKYTSGCTKAVKGFQSFKPVRTEQLTRSSVQGTCMFVGFELHKQLYWSCLPVPGACMKFYSALTNGPAPKPTLEGRISHGHTAVRPARAAQCTSAPETITKYDAIWTGSTGTIKLFSGAACEATERQHLFYLQHLTSFSQSENHSGGTWPYLLEPVAKVASNRSCIWKSALSGDCYQATTQSRPWPVARCCS